jgi:hypothetical protein
MLVNEDLGAHFDENDLSGVVRIPHNVRDERTLEIDVFTD